MPSGFSAGEVLIPLADEYDPMFPNDYEKVVKRQREERQRQRELERQKEGHGGQQKRRSVFFRDSGGEGSWGLSCTDDFCMCYTEKGSYRKALEDH